MTITLDAGLLHAAEATLNRHRHLWPWGHTGAIVHLTTGSLPGAEGTPAWYWKNKGDVFVDLNTLYEGDEKAIKQAVRNIKDNRVPPAIHGLIAHEMAHSRWSTWTADKDTPRAVYSIMELFEEFRIEKRAVDHRAGSAQTLLRQSFTWLLSQMSKGDIKTDPLSLAHTWALAYGRYSASIASYKEIQPIDSAARTGLGDDLVDIMREILEDAVTTSSVKSLEALAREWLELFDVDPDAAPPTMTVFLHASGEGHHGEGDGKGGEKPDDEGEGEGEGDGELAEVLAQSLKEVAGNVESSSTIPVEHTTADPGETAARVFGGHGFGAARGHSWHERNPEPSLRQEAIKMARTLEALSLPSVTLAHRPDTLPPGRLRGREALRQSAERDMGMMSSATPWRRSVRTRSQTKPVIVGVMTDTSGSMSWAQGFVADFAWAMATAGVRIGARTAAVTFGDSAEMVTRPGEVPQQVRERSANGGSEAFDDAAAAIEGVLHLTATQNAAKVLFVISDGHLVRPGEPAKAAVWMERWVRAGTLVCWIGVDKSRWSGLTSRTKGLPGRAVSIGTDGGYGDTKALLQKMERTVLDAARGIR